MIIDIIFVALMVLAVFKGLRNGLVVALFSFLAFIIGLAAAMKLSVVVAEYLADNTNISQKWLPVLAFVIVFFFVVLLVRLGAKAIEGALRLVMLGWLNKIGGIIFYALLYLFIFSILLFYAQQLNMIKPQVADVSVSFKYIYPLAPKVMEGLGAVLPFFRDMFASLESFFEKLAQKS
jgi:membrane protein required for colicin V production